MAIRKHSKKHTKYHKKHSKKTKRSHHKKSHSNKNHHNKNHRNNNKSYKRRSHRNNSRRHQKGGSPCGPIASVKEPGFDVPSLGGIGGLSIPDMRATIFRPDCKVDNYQAMVPK